MSKWTQLEAQQAGGDFGRVRLSGGGTFDAQPFFCVKPVNDGETVTYGDGCEASAGDPPADGDAVTQPDLWPGTSVTLAAGSDDAWVYTVGPAEPSEAE